MAAAPTGVSLSTSWRPPGEGSAREAGSDVSRGNGRHAAAAAGPATLSAFERGFVAAAVLAMGPRAAAFLGGRAVHLAARGAALDADRGALEREILRLDATPPDGIERVHPSWWQRPPSSSKPAARAYLERAATAHLVPMPETSPWTPGTALASLDALSAEALIALVMALGRRRVAVAFSAAPRGAMAQLCARLGEPAASELVAEVKLVRPSQEEVRTAQAALFKLAVDAPDARSLFVSAGARWLAPSLSAPGGDLLRRVAQRLPRAFGGTLIAEAGAPSSEADHRSCAEAVAQLAR